MHFMLDERKEIIYVEVTFILIPIWYKLFVVGTHHKNYVYKPGAHSWTESDEKDTVNINTNRCKPKRALKTPKKSPISSV